MMKTINETTNADTLYFFSKGCVASKPNLYHFGSKKKPRELLEKYWNFLKLNNFDNLDNIIICKYAKEQGVMIDYNYSHYKTHVSITFNEFTCVCEQHCHTIASCLKAMYFLNILPKKSI